MTRRAVAGRPRWPAGHAPRTSTGRPGPRTRHAGAGNPGAAHLPAEKLSAGCHQADAAAVIAIGGVTVDRIHRAHAPLTWGTSNPAATTQGHGGVACNLARNLHGLGHRVRLVSAVGDDGPGRGVLAQLTAWGLDPGGIAVLPGQRTAAYDAILGPGGTLALAVADMAVFDCLDPARIAALTGPRETAAWVFADTNLPGESLGWLISDRPGRGPRLAVDAVSTAKVRKLPPRLAGIDLLFLNADEAGALLGDPAPATPKTAAAAARALVGRGAGAVQLSMGAGGLAVAWRGGAAHVPAVPVALRDATGAGDAMIAATLHGLMAGRPLTDAAALGSLAGALAAEAKGAVRPDLAACLDREIARLPCVNPQPSP